MSKNILFALLALALATMACGFELNIPQKTPGPTLTDEIAADEPDAKTASLTLSFGAGEMTLASGAAGKLVEGTATYNIPDFKPVVKTDGDNVTIEQGHYQVNGFPSFDGMKNEWDLKLSKTPMALTVNAGAYKGEFDLGGLALTELTISDGAAEVDLDFSAPNTEKMDVLTYKTGASNVSLKNLGNANFQTMIFESGAGNYTLDFGGELQRDGSVTIRSGMSNLTISIPEGVAAIVKVTRGLSNVQFPEGWQKDDETYIQEASGPQLTIIIDMGAGNVQITQ